jgi:hypothetical protein
MYFFESHNKQRLFSYADLTDWFSKPRRRVFTARYELNLLMQFKFIFIVWAVSRRPFTAEARIKSQISPCEICAGQSVHCGRFSSEYFGFPLPIISPVLHSLSSSAPCTYQDKRPKPGTFQKVMLFRKSESIG